MFGQSVPEEWTFFGAAQAEAFSRLMYVAESGESFVLLTGEHGIGKSTMLARVKAECTRFGNSSVLINLSALDHNAFLWHLCGALSIVPGRDQDRSELMALVRDEISGRALCNHRTIVLLDDLHRATESPEPLIQYLVALNQQTNGGVTVIGGTEQESLSGLNNLSALRVSLTSLTDEDSQGFVEQRLRTVLTDGGLSDDGVAAICRYGQGSPSRLARVCEVVDIARKTEPQTQIDAKAIAAITHETLLADVA